MHRRSVTNNKVPNDIDVELLPRIIQQGNGINQQDDSPTAKRKKPVASLPIIGERFIITRLLFLIFAFGVGWFARDLYEQPLRKETAVAETEVMGLSVQPRSQQEQQEPEIQRVQIVRRDGRPNEPTKKITSKVSSQADGAGAGDDFIVPGRVFPVYPYEFPCMEFDGFKKRSPSTEGFLYVKEMKAASTTLAGIALRISRNVAERSQKRDEQLTKNNDQCKVRYAHVRARKFQGRDKAKSFLWSFVREPNARMVSKFFHFAVSRANYPIENFTEYYHEYDNWIYDQGYYMKSLAVREGVHPRDPPYYHNETTDLLQDYDFLGITERMDESLAVLQLLLKLETGDLLYINVKEANSYEWFGGHCNRFQPKIVSEKLQTYLDSAEWKEYTAVDRLIYNAVDKSLDRTIDSLGRDVVERQMKKLRFAQSIVEQRCKPIVVFPCSSDGVDQRDKSTCLDGDIGCGHDCLDQVAKELPGMPEFQAL